MDLRENDNENCSVDYFISSEFGGDNTHQSLMCGSSSSSDSRMIRKVSATLE